MDKFLIRKDVYDELIEKGYGKDLSRLTKKQITDKNGHKRTVYVKNGEHPAQQQPKAQEELTTEKKARYEEMIEKVKNGPDENALFVKDKGMLNKKDAIAHLEGKLGKKSGNSAYEGHLESDYPPNTDITKEDEERFGKQALSGLSGKRESSKESKQEKKSDKSDKEKALKEVEDAIDNAGDYDDIEELEKERQKLLKELGRTEEYKENYLDAKNEAGKDIAENNKINELSDEIKFSPDELKMLKNTADEIGYKVGQDEGKLLNAIYSKDKNMYSALTKKNKEAWDKSGKTQKTFSSTDLLKEKIQSMNGDFGSGEETKDTFKSKVNEWESKGLDNRAAHAKVAIDEIIDQIKATPDSDEKKIEELRDLMTDVQLNGLNSKYIKERLKEDKEKENPEKVKIRDDYMKQVSDWQKKGLPRDAAFAKVALDKIVEEIKKTPKEDVNKLDELDNMFRDVQRNNTRSKYIQNILNLE